VKITVAYSTSLQPPSEHSHGVCKQSLIPTGSFIAWNNPLMDARSTLTAFTSTHLAFTNFSWPYKQCCGSGSGVGSGINNFGPGSGQPLLGMNFKQNFSDKIYNFSTKCTIKIKKNLFFPKKFPKKLKIERLNPDPIGIRIRNPD